MTNEQKQALRDKVAAIVANAQANSDTAGEALGVEAAAMIPPDEEEDPGDPGT